jgi:hypothetical protein
MKPMQGYGPGAALGSGAGLWFYTVGLEHVHVNTARMLNMFREGLANLGEIWFEILGQGDFIEIERLGMQADGDFHFPIALWTRIYDYACLFHRTVAGRALD